MTWRSLPTLLIINSTLGGVLFFLLINVTIFENNNNYRMKILVITDLEDRFLRVHRNKKELFKEMNLNQSYMNFTRIIKKPIFSEVFKIKVNEVEI